MKVEFTEKEAKELIAFSEADGAIVRLVDPISQRVRDLAGNPTDLASCSSFWGRCERCENCTSLKALRTEGMAYKLELREKHTYLVVSRFLRIDGARNVLEVVTDITSSLIMDGSQIDAIGKIISNYNYLLVTDPLTKVYNRRFLDEYFLPSLGCCHEEGITVNIAILDLDDFKMTNDTYGHQAGDALLKDVAGFWKRRYNSRTKNAERLVVRYGGDEFLIIACGIDSGDFLTDMRQSYEQMRKVCYVGSDTAIHFSISFGSATSTELPGAWSWEQLFGLADRRLYEDKKRPRD